MIYRSGLPGAGPASGQQWLGGSSSPIQMEDLGGASNMKPPLSSLPLPLLVLIPTTHLLVTRLLLVLALTSFFF